VAITDMPVGVATLVPSAASAKAGRVYTGGLTPPTLPIVNWHGGPRNTTLVVTEAMVNENGT
jgi:hypothetical protein